MDTPKNNGCQVENIKSQDDMKNLIAVFFGQNNILTVPRILIDFTGSLESALMLNQLLYWNSRTDNPGQWIYKSHKDWNDELSFSRQTARTAIEKLKKKKLILTYIKKIKGVPVTHFKIDVSRFSADFIQFLHKEPKNEFGKGEINQSERAKSTNGKGEINQSINTETTDIDYNKDYVINGDVPISKTEKEIGTSLISINLKLIDSILSTTDIKYNNPDTKEILTYYLTEYAKKFGLQHPILKTEYWTRVINDLFLNPVSAMCVDLAPDEWKIIIGKYFSTEFSAEVDYNILHFATAAILDCRFYEVLY